MKLNQKTNKNKINDIANLFYNDKINIVFTNKNATGMFELIKKNFTTPDGDIVEIYFSSVLDCHFLFSSGATNKRGNVVSAICETMRQAIDSGYELECVDSAEKKDKLNFLIESLNQK